MGLVPAATFLVAAAVAAALYSWIVWNLYSLSEVKAITVVQLAAAYGYGIVYSIWIGAEAGFFVARFQPRYESIRSAPREDFSADEDEETSLSPDPKAARDGSSGLQLAEPKIFFLKPSHLGPLRRAGEFIAILGYIYFCDRTTVVAKGPKYMSKTAFWGVNGVILAAGLLTMRRASHGASSSSIDVHEKPLQRDQTEEWKGWMQIMFVLYHYFNETEIYNAIRMYIAAYVWMTGFGNFSYCYIKKDFTAVRFAQMMWRLNFFVFFVCVTMNNEYMLYYICPMHTFFTWGVFIPLYVANQYNDSFKVLLVKIL